MVNVLPTSASPPILQNNDSRDVLRCEVDAKQQSLKLSHDCPVKCEVRMVP